jgi:hypothetical protein
MNLNEEQLNELYSEIEEMAALFFSPEDISVNCGFNDEWSELFVHDVETKNVHSSLASAYFKGRLTADIVIRKAIKQSALNGSSPSQQMMLNFERDSRR